MSHCLFTVLCLFKHFISGYNGIIKKTITFRERMPLAQFTKTVIKMTADLSKEYEKGVRVIALQIH